VYFKEMDNSGTGAQTSFLSPYRKYQRRRKACRLFESIITVT